MHRRMPGGRSRRTAAGGLSRRRPGAAAAGAARGGGWWRRAGRPRCRSAAEPGGSAGSRAAARRYRRRTARRPVSALDVEEKHPPLAGLRLLRPAEKRRERARRVLESLVRLARHGRAPRSGRRSSSSPVALLGSGAVSRPGPCPLPLRACLGRPSRSSPGTTPCGHRSGTPIGECGAWGKPQSAGMRPSRHSARCGVLAVASATAFAARCARRTSRSSAERPDNTVFAVRPYRPSAGQYDRITTK
jgi:hypothetical protein